MENKTCGQKTKGNNFENLAGIFTSGISPANIRFRPSAASPPASTGWYPLATPIFFTESAHHSAGQHLFSRLGRSIFSIFKKMIMGVNYPPLARAEVGASGQRSLVTTPAKPGSYQRPSFFLPTKNVKLRSKSGNEPCCKAGELSMLHRQAPVFHRLYSIYR